jgi:hypothetical protein
MTLEELKQDKRTIGRSTWGLIYALEEGLKTKEDIYARAIKEYELTNGKVRTEGRKKHNVKKAIFWFVKQGLLTKEQDIFTV